MSNVNPDFVLLLVRNAEKNIFKNNDAMISDLDGLEDYFFHKNILTLAGQES